MNHGKNHNTGVNGAGLGAEAMSAVGKHLTPESAAVRNKQLRRIKTVNSDKPKTEKLPLPSVVEGQSVSAYIPRVGDSVAARRKEKSRIYHNLIVGPVVEVWDNACLVALKAVNDNTVEWRLYYNDWSFQFLHPSSEATPEACAIREAKFLDRMRRLKTI